MCVLLLLVLFCFAVVFACCLIVKLFFVYFACYLFIPLLDCMYVYCMDGWMDRWMDGPTNGWTDGRTDGWMDGWKDSILMQKKKSEFIQIPRQNV